MNMLSQKLYLFVTHPTLYSLPFLNMCLCVYMHTHTQSFKTQKYFHLYTIKAVGTGHLNLNYFAFNFWHYYI